MSTEVLALLRDVTRAPPSRPPAPLPRPGPARPALARPPIWLDLSRLLWRVFRGTLTGVDRVELAYAEHLLMLAGDRLRFVAHDYRGGFGLLPHRRTAALVRAIGPAWEDGSLPRLAPRALALFAGSVLNLRRVPPAGPLRPVYLNVSHHPLAKTAAVGALLRRSGAALVPLVHDLIPLDWPEYVPAPETLRHRARLRTIADHAEGVIANSAATAAALRPLLPPALPMLAAPLGVVPRRAAPLPPVLQDGRPFFLCLGTIEPRKNHLMLLHLWRRLAEGPGPVPRLVLVGNRGWDNEQVLDLLDRCTRLAPHLAELGRVPDGVVAGLMDHAQALLMPSFVEGFGLPVAEALARGTPVLCSDIPAHREIAGPVAEYLDPLNLPAWLAAVQAYAAPQAPRRAAQQRRMAGWEAPGWPAHLDAVLGFVEELARRNGRREAEWAQAAA
ncbi:glycosyltransferase family 4 protein [Falsiroseomonas selenitidurans]|uniref:Glycosyltransferase family 4 protein n=1 Tax=Falsiroseomonas selenitidurans TaxID=2716335 RepID=A0ABX1E990_9PROT|nr:glycosyltransferase family 1 protein [Falsiroseomonas selenitidurans]NKC31480.1 glycosyltransferase family 4 protein [Falsiroseomonas selenitidurans]